MMSVGQEGGGPFQYASGETWKVRCGWMVKEAFYPLGGAVLSSRTLCDAEVTCVCAIHFGGHLATCGKCV